MRSNQRNELLEELYAEMAEKQLAPLWESLSQLVTPQPVSPARVHVWSYPDVRKHLLRAGDLITAEEAERRVLVLENPGLPGLSSITPSLYAGLQLLLPGEIAPAHRHMQSALRFVLEGSGAFTAVDGEKAIMQPFDLVLTPAWQWHDHGNPSREPMIWLDGLDIPTVRHFDASFAEWLEQKAQPQLAPPGTARALYGHNMRPLRGSSADVRPSREPLFHYPYSQWRQALEEMAKATDPDPAVGHALEFLNPSDGGAIMRTIAAHVRLLPAGFKTSGRRSTDGTVFVVVEGAGKATIEGEEWGLVERDVIVAPSWREVRFEAHSTMVLFGFSDAAAQRSLGLYREAVS